MAITDPHAPVRFLHPVGQSTVRQGITVPQAVQVGWLAGIRSCQGVPVTIVFGNGESVVATLRRLNNARGHLQFRYETRSQSALRDYLKKLFGEQAASENAVVRIAE